MAARIALSSEIRVLIVDDSPFMRRSLERLLAEVAGRRRSSGRPPTASKRAAVALELRPDVITMDVEMPRMDGVTAVSEIMQTGPTPSSW